MNFVADEGVDRQIVEHLRQEGHDVVYIAELAPSISDDEVLRQANERGALLMTADKDFGELVFRLNQIATGIILLRLEGLAPSTKARAVSLAIGDHGSEMMDAFSVITPGVVRVRRRL